MIADGIFVFRGSTELNQREILRGDSFPIRIYEIRNKPRIQAKRNQSVWAFRFEILDSRRISISCFEIRVDGAQKLRTGLSETTELLSYQKNPTQAIVPRDSVRHEMLGPDFPHENSSKSVPGSRPAFRLNKMDPISSQARKFGQ